MKLKLILCFSFFILSCRTSNVIGQAGKPVLYSLSLQALEKNKSKINNNDPVLMPAYKQLIKDAEKALNFAPVSVMEKKNNPPSGDKHDYMSLAPYFWPDPSKPNGLPYMRKDGETNPEVNDYKDKEYLPKICDMIYTLGLSYYFSGEGMYAEHAAKLLRTWFLDPATKMNPNLNYGQAIKGVNDGRGAGLIDTRHLIKVVEGIGLLKGSKHWKEADQIGMKQWFSDFLNWMQTSKNGTDEMKTKNNHGAWYDAQRLSFALFADSTDLAKRIVANATDRLDKQMDENGFFPAEMERTISLHYTAFVMNAFFTIANMSKKTGFDFWNHTTPSGKSLKKTFDVMKPYLTGEKPWVGQQIKDYNFEDSYPILMDATYNLKCRNCEFLFQKLADEKAPRLRINLLY